MFWRARDFKIAQRILNNNPPTGELEDDYWGSLTVDPDVGINEFTPLALLVLFPPITKVPIFQCQA
jgi:hypothetical protein